MYEVRTFRLIRPRCKKK